MKKIKLLVHPNLQSLQIRKFLYRLTQQLQGLIRNLKTPIFGLLHNFQKKNVPVKAYVQKCEILQFAYSVYESLCTHISYLVGGHQ